MIWGRAGWSGIQRYPMQWGGDPQSDWGGLEASIRGGLSYGLTGVPYWATDVGGFYGEPPDAELFVRWTAASVFGPKTPSAAMLCPRARKRNCSVLTG
jgi:alpha-D-xyloside xylohydrolase